MKVSMRLTQDRLASTLRWIGLQAMHGTEPARAETPLRFERAARRASGRGFGERT